MTTFSPRVSKLAIIPVDRESLINAIIPLEKLNDQISNRFVLSLKDTCTRRLLLFFGDDHQIYQKYLSSRLIRYVTYDYLSETNNTEHQLTNDEKLIPDSKLLCCRDCSINNLGASKCRRRKCLANRVRHILHQLSILIIPWEKRQCFAILENDDDDDDDNNPVVFIHLKSSNSQYQKWIEEQFYLLDLLRILRINMFRE
jgi:hypothetical protein